MPRPVACSQKTSQALCAERRSPLPTKMARHPREPETSGIRVFPLPIKLYLYGDLLFELFHGGKRRQQVKTACEKMGTRLYRAADVLFEIQDGGQTRFEIEVGWERMGFPVNEPTVEQPDLLACPPSAPSRRRTRRSRPQATQLDLWSLD
jgi:hypothetical protein